MTKGKSQSTPDSDVKKHPSKRILGRRRPRPAFFALLLLVTISAGYYALYFFNHGDDLRDYYLRRLLVSTDNAEQAIDRLWHNVEKNLGRSGKIELIPAFESNNVNTCDSLRSSEDNTNNGISTVAGWPGSDAAYSLENSEDDTSSGISTVAGWIGSDAVLCFFGSDPSKIKTPPANLTTLFESKLPNEDFDSILLTRQNGEVLLLQQHQNMAIDIVRLDITEIQKFDELASGSGQESVNDIELEHTAIGEFSFAETTYLAFVQPMRIPIELNWSTASNNKLDYTKEKTWFLIGLKEKGRFRAEAMAISPTALLVILSVVILALFALPYLKLRFIGSREALHKHDVLVLTITLLIAISGITLALLELQMRGLQKEEIDDRLNLVAEDISDKFSEEVKSIDAQLRTLTFLKGREPFPGVPWFHRTKTNLLLWTIDNRLHLSKELPTPSDLPLFDYPFLEMAYWMDKTGQQTKKWSIKDKTTSLINVGDRNYFKNAHDFKFTNSMDYSKLVPDTSLVVPGWSLESIRSKNTGEVSAVLSHQVDSEGGDIVAAVYTSLLSVIEPVLPPGFEFAIIDDQGNVLFHQDPTRNLSENLFDWVDKDDSLRATVWSRNEQTEMDVNYRARDYRMHIRPLDSTPWSLVVLYDVLDSRLVRVDILTVAFFLYLIYLIAFLLMHFYLWGRTPETLKNPFFIWLWPDRKRVHIYFGFLLIAAINIIVWSILFWQGSRNGFIGQTGVVTLSALLGLITFGFSYRLLRLSNSKNNVFAMQGNLRIRFQPFFWYAITLLTAVLVLREESWGVITGAAVASTALLAVLHAVSTKFAQPFKVERTLPVWWSRLYLASLCAIVGVIAVLPTFMFYGIAHDEIMELSAKRELLTWSESLGNRYKKYLEQYQGIAMHAGPEKLIRDQLQLTGESNLGDAWDIHGVDEERTAREKWATEDKPTSESCVTNGGEPSSSNSVLMFAAELIPGYTAESYELRSLANAGASEYECWRYTDDTKEDSIPSENGTGSSEDDLKTLYFMQERYRRDFTFGKNSSLKEDIKFVDLQLSRPRTFFALPGFMSEIWIIALLISFVLVGITRNLLRLVYLMDLKLPVFMSGDCWPKTPNRQHTLVLRGSNENKSTHQDGSDPYMIDTSHIETDEEIDKLLNDALSVKPETICLTQFHIGLWDSQVANRKLLLLERLLTSGPRLEVHSDINPLHFFLMRSRDYLRGLADSEPDLGRWVAVLAEFTRCRPAQNEASLLSRLSSEQTGHASEKTTSVLKLLADECWTSNELEEIAVTIAGHPRFREFAEDEEFPEAIINQVLDQAEPYYRILWAISSKDERMVLYHVAIHGFVSWRSSDVVRRLINRGLIQMVPHPRLMNRSFWRFVRHAEMPEVLEQWTEEAGASGWSRLKGPVSVAVVLTIAFLFATQPQLLRQSMALTAILAAGAPALVKLFSMLAQSRIGGGSKD